MTINSSIFFVSYFCLASTPNPDLVSLGSSLCRRIRTACAQQEDDHCPWVYRNIRISQASVGKHLVSSNVIPKLPFLVQGNKHVLVGLFYISYLYLKDVRLQGKDGWALLSVSLIVVLAQLVRPPFPICNVSPASPTPLIPGPRHYPAVPFPIHAQCWCSTSFSLQQGSQCEGKGSGVVRLGPTSTRSRSESPGRWAGTQITGGWGVGGGEAYSTTCFGQMKKPLIDLNQ